jgi:transcriptional regulator with XRE-family HTH domain
VPGKEPASSPPRRRRENGQHDVRIRPKRAGRLPQGRRARLAPQDFGLPETDSRRKVGGLRREEVAALAAISVDYYTRLEQGRVRASATVLATLARALRLDEDQQRYLHELAGARPRRRRPAQRVRPAMRRLLDQLTATPAVVLGKRLDILEWNSAAAALYTDFRTVAGTTCGCCSPTRSSGDAPGVGARRP